MKPVSASRAMRTMAAANVSAAHADREAATIAAAGLCTANKNAQPAAT
jgi:hypothetical protein